MINITPGAVQDPSQVANQNQPATTIVQQPTPAISLNTPQIDLSGCVEATAKAVKPFGAIAFGAILTAAAFYFVPKALDGTGNLFSRMRSGHSDGWEGEDGEEYELDING